MLISYIHNREALYILSKVVAKPKLESSSHRGMETARGKEEMGAEDMKAVSWKNSVMQH